MREGLDFEPAPEDVLKVYSEMKEGMSLRTPDSVVAVLRDEMVFKSYRSREGTKSVKATPHGTCAQEFVGGEAKGITVPELAISRLP